MALSGMLAPNLKATEKVDFTSVLRNFITSSYNDSPGAHDQALASITNMRMSAAQTIHPGLVGDIIRYCQQAEKLAEKFPMKDTSKILVNFDWEDAFKAGRKHRTNDINYDIACFVFNLGACHANQAKNTSLNDDGCKSACQAYQAAAGAFTYVRDVCTVKFGRSPQMDMQMDVLSTMISIMLGQAQECFLRKALLGNMSPAILSKLASSASDFFTEAVIQSAASGCKGVFSKQWINTMSAKKAMLATTAVYYQGLAQQKEGEYGLCVAYLKVADTQMKKTTPKLAKSADVALLVSADKIATDYKDAKSENEKIYFQPVAIDADVPMCPRHVMVKATPLSLAEGEDLLAKLVPVAIRNAHARYVDDVQKLIRDETEKINNHLKKGSNELQEIAMPAALDALEQPMGVPESLLQRSQNARSKGGVSGIRDRLDNMRNLYDQNALILDESDRILSAEATEDNQLRQQYMSEWSRAPSEQVSKELHDECRGMRNKLDMARTADGTVRRRFDESLKVMESLCRTDDLANLLPDAGAANLPQRVKTLSAEIRDLLAKYDTQKEQSTELKHRLTQMKASDSIVSKLVEASRTAADEKTVMANEMAVFKPIQNDIAKYLQSQDELLDKIKTLAKEFNSYNIGTDLSRKRQNVLDNLSIAGDTLDELYNNLGEGYNFYSDMLNRLLKFQTKCSDMATGRRMEAEELKRRITVNRQTPQRPAPPRGSHPGQAPQQPGYWQPGQPVAFQQQTPSSVYPPGYSGQQAPPGPYQPYQYTPNHR